MSRPVISAEDVRAAARRGELSLALPEHAIVTPLARDEAARRGIDLIEGLRDASTVPRPDAGAAVANTRSATCDPDELERIVERVRARVPNANPEQVRDIARRLLERLGG